MISKQKGRKLVFLAKKAIETFIEDGKILKNTEFLEKKGVFVTIYDSFHNLRGCIGYPYPSYPLGEAVIRAAISAAFEDPRFPPLSKNEIPNIIIEVSVLTEPKLIECNSPEEYLEKINIGTDGLIVSRGFNSGLLLPQVPLEYKWTPKEFLEHTCLKAGLPPDSWKDKSTRVYKFQAQVFK